MCSASETASAAYKSLKKGELRTDLKEKRLHELVEIGKELEISTDIRKGQLIEAIAEAKYTAPVLEPEAPRKRQKTK